MQRLEIDDFDIELRGKSVLGAFGGNDAVFDVSARYFDELKAPFYKTITPFAAAVMERNRIYCVLTLGEDISALTDRLFSEGEAIKGLICDAMADQYLFEMDNILSERIKRECAVMGVGISKRLSAPEDYPLSEQPVILGIAGSERVSVTEAFMLKPVKSMAYVLELTDNKEIFNAQHNCSSCAAKNCPRRTAAYKGGYEILSGYAYTPEKDINAVCIDIGTTTVVFERIIGRETVASYKTVNPQRRFGCDVLSRIEAANRGRAAELGSDIRYTLKKGYDEVTRGYATPEITVIAGNTAMIYLLMGYDCAELGRYPFKSAHLNPVCGTLDKIISAKNEPVPTVIFGGISAFVGGDIVSGLYMCGFDRSEKINLFIDLGTNGEMAIGNKHKIIATSAAAGPAFEGGLISCGTGSVDGAICSVSLKPFSAETICGKPPVGICGTGIIELLSEMKRYGIIDGSGLLCDKYFKDGYPVTDKIRFTQNDIRQTQMAKSAVRAGIECLIKEYGAEYADIDTVYLAGGFGYGLSALKACNIGLLPPEIADKTVTVGNSSLGGCVRLCCDDGGGEVIRRIQTISSDFPLADNKAFNELYLKYMNF